MEEFDLSYQNYHLQGYRAGSGAHSVVLLHGAGMDSAMLSYREVMENLSSRYTVYAYDQLGYGKSDLADETMSVELNVLVLRSVLRRLGLTDFSLIGLSMGGSVALGYCLDQLDYAAPRCLIAIDSWGLISKMPFHALTRWYANTFSTRAQYRFLGRHRGLLKWSLAYALFGDRANISEALLDELSELCRSEGAGLAMEDFQRSSLARSGVVPDYAARLSELVVPVMFVNGERDPAVLPRHSLAASQIVPQGEYFEIPNARHWAQKEYPEIFCDAAVRFIEKHR